jgi:bla regulator protein blaR1
MIPTDLSPLENHLWQSSLCAAVVWLLTFVLRKNRAAVRYWLWLTAAAKFLVPFSLLVSIGDHLGWRSAPAIGQPRWTFVIDGISRSLAVPAPTLQAITVPSSNPIPIILFVVWISGCALSVLLPVRCWRQIRTARRGAIPLALGFPIPVLSSPTPLEPGVFGIRKAVLLLPEGITERLAPAQLEAILAHELCHVRRRDNLTAVIHLVAETVFWFFPLLLWMRARLVEARERACDEDVLRLGTEPQVYAEGILKVCEFYLESPVVCVAGVTGANLKQRIEAIMKNRTAHKLNVGRKLMLATAALIVVAGPFVVGMMNVPAILSAQSLPAFEVASVKPHRPGDPSLTFPQFLPGGKFSVVGVPLQIVIAFAYNLPFQGTQLSGGPDWIRSAENIYDIEAKGDEDALKGLSSNDRADKLRLMLQAMLAERFKLTIRRDRKEQPVYTLTVGKNGPKLQKSKVEEKDCDDPANQCHFGGGGQGRGIHVKAFDMTELVVFLSNFTDRPLIDRTGLTGLYDIDTDGWVPMRQRPVPPGAEPTPESAALADPTRPTLYMIFEKLGLKMGSSKAPVEMFVIDHVEKPTEN